jgi:hypothetical protein
VRLASQPDLGGGSIDQHTPAAAVVFLASFITGVALPVGLAAQAESGFHNFRHAMKQSTEDI